MLRTVFPILAGLAALAAEPSAAQDTPRTYVLVAAVGDEFNLAYEVPSTGTHISPYRRSTVHGERNILNRLVLSSLDKAVAGMEPRAARVYLAIAVPAMEETAPALRGKAAIDSVVRELEKMPGRAGWDRIVVATPAYSASGHRGLPSRLQGMGVFTQSLCQSFSALTNEGCEFGLRGADGPEAQTPQGETVRASQYVAPYSYLEIWVLDPKTLEVLDRRVALDTQKLVDPMGSPDLSQNLAPEFLSARIVGVIEGSVRAAVRASELRGTVEVSDVKPVDPGKAAK